MTGAERAAVRHELEQFARVVWKIEQDCDEGRVTPADRDERVARWEQWTADRIRRIRGAKRMTRRAKPDDRVRFEKYQRRYAEAEQRLAAIDDLLRRKYGPGFLSPWLNKGETQKREAAQAAEGRAVDGMFNLLDRISPRRWRSGVAAWWVMEKLTYEDAVTDGPLSMVPQPGYGTTHAQAKKFAEEPLTK